MASTPVRTPGEDGRSVTSAIETGSRTGGSARSNLGDQEEDDMRGEEETDATRRQIVQQQIKLFKEMAQKAAKFYDLEQEPDEESAPDPIIKSSVDTVPTV